MDTIVAYKVNKPTVLILYYRYLYLKETLQLFVGLG